MFTFETVVSLTNEPWPKRAPSLKRHKNRETVLAATEDGGTADQSTRVNIAIDSEEDGRTADQCCSNIHAVRAHCT